MQDHLGDGTTGISMHDFAYTTCERIWPQDDLCQDGHVIMADEVGDIMG